jgi:hypothetical protein
LLITQLAHIYGLLLPRSCINFDKKWAGLHFGRFFANSSGHPAREELAVSVFFPTNPFSLFYGAWPILNVLLFPKLDQSAPIFFSIEIFFWFVPETFSRWLREKNDSFLSLLQPTGELRSYLAMSFQQDETKHRATLKEVHF